MQVIAVSNSLWDPELIGAFKYYGTIALDLAASMIGGFLFGRFCDSVFGIAPWGMLAGPLLGAVAGYVSVYRLVMQEAKKKQKPGR